MYVDVKLALDIKAEIKNEITRPVNKIKKLLSIYCFLKVNKIKKLIRIANPTINSPNLKELINNPLKVRPKIVINTM